MNITRTVLAIASSALLAGASSAQSGSPADAPGDRDGNNGTRGVERIVLEQVGEDISVKLDEGGVVVFLDGERVRTMGPHEGDGESRYRIVGKDGTVFGELVRKEGYISFSDMGEDDTFSFEREATFGEPVKGRVNVRVDANDTSRVMIGITMAGRAPESVLESFDLDRDEVTYITDVIEGLPADNAGLKPGDVIVKVGEEDSGDLDTLRSVLKTRSPGDTLKVTVLRDGDRKQFVLGLKSYEASALNGGSGARGTVEARRTGRRATAEKIEALREKMAELGEKMKETSDPSQLQEYGTKMGRYGAEIGRLSAALAMEEMRGSGVIEGFDMPDAPDPPRIVVPEWGQGEGAERTFRFLLAPGDGDGEGAARMREFMERLAERTERADEQIGRYQERIEQLLQRMTGAPGGEVETEELDRGDAGLDQRLDKFDERLGRLESMIERLLEERQ